MAENRTVPEIRFAGFAGDWEKRKLSDISNKVTEKNLIMEYSETFTNSAEFGIISQRDYFDHDISNAQNLNSYYIVKPEDFVYNPRISTLAPVGPINRNKLRRCGVMSPLYTVLRPYDIDNAFLEQFFKSKHWHSFMILNGDTGARSDRFSIKDATFIEMPIPYPIVDEQQRIGIYLAYLDNLIALHQRKYDKLVIVKKSMLEKMFPKDGDYVPEIRFAGFTAAWERRKVGELLTERNIQSPKSVEYPLMAFIAYEGVAPKGDRYNRDFLVNDEVNKKYKQTEYGDFIYSSNNLTTGSIGLNNFGKASISPVYSVFQTTELANPNFIGRLLVRKSFIDQMIRWRQGVIYGQWRIHESDFVKIEVKAPSVEEQQKIGNFFRNLDTTITLHQQELEKLKNIKKSMLDKMFV